MKCCLQLWTILPENAHRVKHIKGEATTTTITTTMTTTTATTTPGPINKEITSPDQ